MIFNPIKNQTATVERPQVFLLCQKRSHFFPRIAFIAKLPTLPWSSCSVLWLDVMSIAGGRRLSAFGCQNGCVGLALVNQSRPGEARVTLVLNRCASFTSFHFLPVCPVGFLYISSSRIIVSDYANG